MMPIYVIRIFPLVYAQGVVVALKVKFRILVAIDDPVFLIIPVCVYKIPSFLAFRRRAGLIIVADDIEIPVLSSICRIVSPVVDDIVAVVDMPAVRLAVILGDIALVINLYIDLRMVYPGVAAVVMGKQVVVEGCIASTPDATIAMATLGMPGLAQGLGEKAPLQREIPVGIE